DWLAELEIDIKPIIEAVGRIAIVNVDFNAFAGRYTFRIYDSDHIGPKYPCEFALPIKQAGAFADLLLIDCGNLTFRRVCTRTNWLGGDEFGCKKIIRLHRDPVDWLEAGCEGVCYLEPI